VTRWWRLNDSQEFPYIVFQRADRPNCWVRFSIAGHDQKRIGLKTADLTEANKLAEREYNRAVWGAEEGICPGKTSFDSLARRYLASAETAGARIPASLVYRCHGFCHAERHHLLVRRDINISQ
jgi:hypothetical protein